MCWLKKVLWKAGIACAGMLLLLLVAIAGIPVSAVDAHKELARLAGLGTVTVQVTPTEDATVTALNKEKLAQEVQQLKNQNEPDPFGWFRTNAAILLSTLAVVFGGLFGFWRWRVDRRDAQEKDLKAQQDAQEKELGDRKAEREKRAEERFQSVVEGLGSEREEAKVGAAIMLRTFLRPDYDQFYTQVFDLSVANLRLLRTPHRPEEVSSEEDPHTPLPATTLRQALIVVFKEAFPLARSQRKGRPPSLDASRIQLDYAYLRKADLKEAWMPEASLRNADLREADLTTARLWKADLREADLTNAILRGINLWKADLREADLSSTDIDNAYSLEDTDLRGVKGLSEEQLAIYKAKGAIINEDLAIDPSRLPVSPPLPLQSNELQAPSISPTQRSSPTSNTDERSATFSKPSLEP